MPAAPYTHEELRAMTQKAREAMASVENAHPQARPLPPMEEDEAKDLLFGLAHTATTRLLTDEESFLIGQLMASYRMAVEARMLGKPGRYFVVSEDQVNAMNAIATAAASKETEPTVPKQNADRT